MLHLFNPENDLALASGSRNYTPPRNARLLAKAGEALPIWLAAAGDSVLAENPGADVQEIISTFCPAVSITDSAKGFRDYSPWGWSAYAADIFRKKGGTNLPSEEWLENHRQLSHRRSSVRLAELLAHSLPFLIPEPAIEITDPTELDRIDYPFFIKSPWSSSGRGVFRYSAAMHRQIKGLIRAQGSVMAEKALSSIRDFAMLFTIKDGHARFLSYSLFTNSGTSYAGNLVALNSRLRAELEKLIPGEYLAALESEIPKALEIIFGKHYDGNLGVDMMVYTDAEGENMIAPAIEINLRNTMGFVAMNLAEKLLHPASTAEFSVIFGGCETLTPPVFHDGRLLSGDFLPIGKTPDFTFLLRCL